MIKILYKKQQSQYSNINMGWSQKYNVKWKKKKRKPVQSAIYKGYVCWGMPSRVRMG